MLPKGRRYFRSLILQECGRLRDPRRGLQCRAFPSLRGIGHRTEATTVRLRQLRAPRLLPHSREGGVSPTSPSPARPPRPPRPRVSASCRRKCCVAHFRVLSGRRRRASPVSRPPPLPPPPLQVLEPGATSPPWPASKVGLGRRAPEVWVAA